MKKKIRAGVAGMGFIGPVHVEALRRLPNVEVVSLYHHNAKAAQKSAQLGIANYYSDFDEFVQNHELDCIHICTPNHTHFEMARKVLLKGIHVVCEKPLSMTVEESVELVALAKEKGLVHAVNFNVRYYPLVRQMKVMRKKGEIGTIYSIMGSYLQDWLSKKSDYNWRLEAEKGGRSRAIADIGSHLLDLVEYVTGLRIVAVMADFSTVHKIREKPLRHHQTYSVDESENFEYEEIKIDTEDQAGVLLRFSNGSKGVVMVSQVAAGRKNQVKLEVSGSICTASWESQNPNALWLGYRDKPNTELLRDSSLMQSEAAAITSYPGGHNEGFADTGKQLFSEVYDAISNGLPEKPEYPTFESGLRELRLCKAILKSQERGIWITV